MIFIGMPAPKPQLPAEPLCLIFGDEDFLVRERASQVFEGWCAGAGGEDHEIVDGTVRNAAEALAAAAASGDLKTKMVQLGNARLQGMVGSIEFGDKLPDGGAQVLGSDLAVPKVTYTSRPRRPRVVIG